MDSLLFCGFGQSESIKNKKGQKLNYYKGSLQKKIWNFPKFSGVGGFEKVIFHKK